MEIIDQLNDVFLKMLFTTVEIDNRTTRALSTVIP